MWYLEDVRIDPVVLSMTVGKSLLRTLDELKVKKDLNRLYYSYLQIWWTLFLLTILKGSSKYDVHRFAKRVGGFEKVWHPTQLGGDVGIKNNHIVEGVISNLWSAVYTLAVTLDHRWRHTCWQPFRSTNHSRREIRDTCSSQLPAVMRCVEIWNLIVRMKPISLAMEMKEGLVIRVFSRLLYTYGQAAILLQIRFSRHNPYISE